jgi:dTDP-3-amino-3,4,6-trideoxy-alpha-D-glucose transaminase
LRRLEEFNDRRTAAAQRYAEALGDLDLVLPTVGPWATPVWHLYVVRTPHRDALSTHLAEHGVETGVHYPVPPHRQQAFAGTALAKASFPVAEALAGEVLSLPMGPHLPEAAQQQVIDAILSFRA